jgi:predicted amidohydrolase
VIDTHPAVLERVGYFHFVDSFENPIETLTEEISKAKARQEINNSLIVLPEAFNQGHYSSGDPKISACKTRAELRRLAALHKLTFVAGILDGRCNTACWIDAAGSQLMCHKMGNDGTDLYDPCIENCEKENPLDCTNARLGALICMDAIAPTLERHRKALFQKVRASTSTRIICVPARFKKISGDTKSTQDLSGCWYVVANGSWTGLSSSITDPAGVEIEATGGDTKNEIKVQLLHRTG